MRINRVRNQFNLNIRKKQGNDSFLLFVFFKQDFVILLVWD